MYVYECILCISIHLNPTCILQGKGWAQDLYFYTHTNNIQIYLTIYKYYKYIHIYIFQLYTCFFCIYIYIFTHLWSFICIQIINKYIYIYFKTYTCVSSNYPNLSVYQIWNQKLQGSVPRNLAPAMTACFYGGRSSCNPSTIPTVGSLRVRGGNPNSQPNGKCLNNTGSAWILTLQ